MRTKRVLSIVLTLAMLLGMLPGMSLTASAADTTTTITPGTDDAKTGTGTMTITLKIKAAQTITASDVTATYGETDKSVSATTDGNGEISYAVKAGSEDYISVASDGKLTIKKVPADDKAYVTVTASETNTGGTGGNGYAAATKDVTVNISKATVAITAKDQSIYVGGTVPTLSGADFYTVSGLVGEDALTTNPTLAYQKNGSAATPDNTTAGTYDIVASGASAGDNYNISYTNGTLTISDKGTQTISAENVTVTYGETGKSVSATVTDPATGGGDISYAVKTGSADYIDVDASTGALTIKKVPADGKAYVTVTAAETATYEQATKEVTVTINKANAVPATVTANNRTYDGTEKPLVTVTSETTGGTLKFAVTTEDQEPAADAYNFDTTSIPSATDAGTYYVWYKVNGDANHNNTEPDFVEAKINPVDKAELNKAIKEAEDYYNIIKDNPAYSEQAKALSDAIKAANELADNKNAKDNEVSAGITAVTEAKKKVEAEVKDIDDAAAAKKVTDAINAIPTSDKVATTDKAAIEAARKAYDALSADQKAKVPADTLKKLTDAEKALVVAEANDKAAKELAAAKQEAQASMNEQVTVTQKGNKFTVKWKKSSSADGYYVYASYCGKKAAKPAKTIKKNTTTKTTITKINGKKINQKKNFHVYVVPYKIIDGKKVTLGKSTVAHLVGAKNTKYSNVKKLTLTKKKYTVKVGKTAKIKAKVTLVNKNKKHISTAHGTKFRYKSSDTSIATVDKNGKIKGIKKGTCTIYVYSINGLMKKAKVTVK